MSAKDYIASGKLELYVYGILPETERGEIYDAIQNFPEVKLEVEKIEMALKLLSEQIAPPVSSTVWKNILLKISRSKSSSVSNQTRSITWFSYSGWAAVLLLLIGLFWLYNKNNQLQSEWVTLERQNQELLEKIVLSEEIISEKEELINLLRDKNIKTINLPGHTPIAPEAYAKVFYNQQSNTIHLDAKGLPNPPEGMVYQVWSLKMNPLTPTSIGLLEQFNTDVNKIFILLV